MTRRKVCGVALALVMVGGWTGAAWAETPICQLGYELRVALGFGPREMATLGVSAGTHQAIINAANTYCQNNRQTVEPLLGAIRTAWNDVNMAYQTSGDVASAEAALLNAVEELAEGTGSIASTLAGNLSSELQTIQARLAANLLQDPSYAALDLDGTARSAVTTAQRTRDGVLRHGVQRKNGPATAAAWNTFTSTAGQALSGAQQTSASQHAQTHTSYLASVLATEEANCGQ